MPKIFNLKLLRTFITKSHLVVLSVFVFLAIVAESPFGYYANNMIAQRLAFKTRSILQMEPTFDSHIKVIAFDDQTLDFVGAENLPLATWGKLLSVISDAKPKMILIDRHFGLVKDQDPATSFASLNTTMETRTIAGSYLDSRLVTSEDAVNFDHDEYNLEMMMNQSGYDVRAIKRLAWMPITSGTLVGPSKNIAENLKFIGHRQLEDFGYIQPFVRINQKFAVPHLSLLAAKKLSVTPKNLLVNGKVVYLNRNNLIVPNTLSAETINLRALSLKTFIRSLTQPLLSINTMIKPGDIVIILPKMYQTNADWVNAPLEKQQSGYILTSLVNSIQQNNWLRPVNAELPLLALACLLGHFFATALPKHKFRAAMASSVAATLVFSLGSFCLLGWIIPWIFPATGMLLCGSYIFSRLSAITNRKIALLENSLHGRIPAERIANIISHPNLLQPDPVSKIITVMFVNIVDFSQLAERQPPDKSFASLKELFNLVRSVVLANGGIVDRTIGDSMLVYFGYSPDGQHRAVEHADDALKCGIKIQERLLTLNKKKSGKGEAIYPVRIGINTSSVYVGNIGADGHLDFAVIGHGVNIAKRLEGACRHYCITIGASTFDTLVHRQALSTSLVKQFLPSPNNEAMLESYECDPFLDSQHNASEVAGEHRKSQASDRHDERWPVPNDLNIMFASGYGPARLVDFSNSGFGVTLDKFLGAGVVIEFSLIYDHINYTYTNEFNSKIQGEVRWARPGQGGFLHGILIKNLSPEQREQLTYHFRSRMHVASELIFEN